MMFAQSFLDFGISEGVLHIVRVIAAVGGAIVGWFVADPITRLVYRVSFKGPTPMAVLLGAKGIGAATLALVLYFCVSLGGGGGVGFGPGPGGLPGKGPGKGGDKVAAADGKDGKTAIKDKVDSPAKSPKTIESIEIEIISMKDFQDDGMDRFFLLRRARPALSPGELEAFFQKNHATIEVTPVLTRDSIGVGQPGNPLSRLLALTKKYDVKTLQTRMR